MPEEEVRMSFNLAGRTAVVTGGTRGIGRGIAEIFLEHGANVVVNGRSVEKGEQALKEMGGGDNVHFVQGDVMKKVDVEALVDDANARYGRVDILVNNAGGITGHGMIADMDDWAWLGTIEWNLNSAFWATRRALKYMVPQQWGRIINISSVEGKQANKAAVSNYITTKHALNGFTKATAFEYGPMGITANAICPGAIETDIMRESGPDAAAAAGITYEQFLQNYADESMIKRLNKVEEVAALALVLASDAGGGITGALLNVDGGTASW
jgi:3-hydroxybutyrate dehydrogenase